MIVSPAHLDRPVWSFSSVLEPTTPFLSYFTFIPPHTLTNAIFEIVCERTHFIEIISARHDKSA